MRPDPRADVFQLGSQEPLPAAFGLLGDLPPEGLGFEKRGVISRMRKRAAIRDFDDPRGDRLQKIPVVCDENQRAGKFAQEVFEPADRLGVEVVRRLVEEEKIRLRGQCPAECDAALFSARERPDQSIERRGGQRARFRFDSRLQVPAVGMLDEFEQVGEFVVVPVPGLVSPDRFNEVRRACLDVFEHGFCAVQLELLRQIPDAQPAPPRDVAGVRL